jgi:hypothetical protein
MMLIATCCTIAALSAPAPASPHPGWEPLIDGARTPIEIDRRRIMRQRGFADVWVRASGDPATVAAEFEAAGAGADEIERVRAGLRYSEHLWSFYCEDGTHSLAYSAYYAQDGSLIRAFEVSQRAYWPVQPDTVGQRLLSAACGAKQASAGDDDETDGDPSIEATDASSATPR